MRECECGNPKTPKSLSCQRCRYLDGGTPVAMHAIMMLRGTDGLTIRELCEEVYGRVDTNATVSMLRILQRLTRTGRIRRYMDEIQDTSPRTVFGKYKAHSMAEAYRYALWGEAQ